MNCPNCKNPIHFLSLISKQFGCSNCQNVYLITPDKNLSHLFKSTKFNVNYLSSENFKLSDYLELDEAKFKILNRTIWVSNHFQLFEDTDNSNSLSFSKRLFQIEFWQLQGEDEKEYRIEKSENDLLFCEEIDANFKDFAHHHFTKGNLFSSIKDELQISIRKFESNKRTLAFQDGVINFHYLEGEFADIVNENSSFRFSNYKQKNKIWQIESKIDNFDISESKTFLKSKIYKIKDGKYSLKNWFARLF